MSLCRIQGTGIHCKSVVLGGDVHGACFQVLNRLVGTPVPELQLVRTGSQCQGYYLVAEADAVDGDFSHHVFYNINGSACLLWIARAV